METESTTKKPIPKKDNKASIASAFSKSKPKKTSSEAPIIDQVETNEKEDNDCMDVDVEEVDGDQKKNIDSGEKEKVKLPRKRFECGYLVSPNL